jgi:hypothetical protein
MLVCREKMRNAVTIRLSAFGGLVVSMPLVPKIMGSLPTEAVRFFQLEKSTACLPSEGK